MRKPTPPARLSARIRQLRRFFAEYDRCGVVLGGGSVDALAERLRGFEIDAETMESRSPAIRPAQARVSEIARRYRPAEDAR